MVHIRVLAILPWILIAAACGGGGSESLSGIEASLSVAQTGSASRQVQLPENTVDEEVAAVTQGNSFSMVFLSDPQFFRHIVEDEARKGYPQPKVRVHERTGLGGRNPHQHELLGFGRAGVNCVTSVENSHRHTYEPDKPTNCDKPKGDSTNETGLHAHALSPESTDGGEECFLAGVRRNGDKLCDSIATNEALVDAIDKIAELETFPADWECEPDSARYIDQEIVWSEGCLLYGNAADIVRPAAVVINGDLTESSSGGEHTGQLAAFEEIYGKEKFDQPLLVGLGNHDYKGVSEENRNAIERMSNNLESINEALTGAELGGLTDHHMQGIVHLRNNSARQVRFKIRGDCPTAWEVVRAQRWGRRTVRESCQNVRVQVQQKRSRVSGGGWRVVDEVSLSDPVTNTCLVTNGESVRFRLLGDDECIASINPGIVSTEERRKESDREGSMSYSFDIGSYHFVQLHWALGYEDDFRDITPRLQGFNITSAYRWLERDLQNAAAQGKVSVINVHEESEENWPKLRELLGNPNFNVVAVFAGHLHNALGRTGVINIPLDAPVRKIPVFRTGSGSCGTMIYVDFNEDYFNWAAVRAWNQASSGADYIRPRVEENAFGRKFAIGEPVFIEDDSWNCHYETEGDVENTKFGTIKFSALLVREPVGEPPVAACRDVEVDANEDCEASASIDNGSYDPEGGMITLSQDPSGPFGPGENLVTLTVFDEDGNTASCQGTVTVTDVSPPAVSCNVPDVGPPHAPLTITTTGTDNCSVSDIRIHEPDCFRINGAGRRVDLGQACSWSIDEENLTLDKTMGVGTQYQWQATAIDEGGNESREDCNLVIGNPGEGG